MSEKTDENTEIEASEIEASEMNIYQRLSKASGMCEKLAKENKAHNYNYASHDQYVAMCRPILNECGICVTFDSEINEACDMVTVRSKFVNIDYPDNFTESSVTVPMQRKDPQGMGAVLSYGKKYILALNLMIETGDDADGNKTDKDKKPPKGKTTKTKPTAQKKEIEWTGELGTKDQDDFKGIVNAIPFKKGDMDAISKATGYSKQVFFDAANMILDENINRKEINLEPADLSEMLEVVAIVLKRETAGKS